MILKIFKTVISILILYTLVCLIVFSTNENFFDEIRFRLIYGYIFYSIPVILYVIFFDILNQKTLRYMSNNIVRVVILGLITPNLLLFIFTIIDYLLYDELSFSKIISIIPLLTTIGVGISFIYYYFFVRVHNIKRIL